MLKLYVNNVYSYIYDYIPDLVYKDMEGSLSYLVQNHEFSNAFNEVDEKTGKRKWDGRKRLIWKNSKGISFSTGLVSSVIFYLKKYDIDFKTVDNRVKPKRSLDIQFSEGIVPRPYQELVIKRGIKKQRGIIHGATGMGKTICAAGLMKEIGSENQIFLAMSSDLIIQARDEFQRFLSIDGSPVEVGIIGAGMCDIKKGINVMTVQSACAALGVKYEAVEDDGGKEKNDEVINNKKAVVEVLRNADAILFDEVQHASCSTVKDVMSACKSAFYRYGLSGSPWRDDGSDLEIDSHFGRRHLTDEKIAEIKRRRKSDTSCLESERGYIINISASYLIDLGYLVEPTIYMIKLDGSRDPYLTYPKIYKRRIVENKSRNDLIKKISKNLSQDERNSLLVLVKQIVHGKSFEKDIEDSLFLSGSMSNKKRKDGLDRLRNNDLKIAIASSIFDEGLDVKRLNCLILAGSGKSSTRALQRIGRVIRPFTYSDGVEKDRAIVFDFIDPSKYVSNHSYERMKIYKQEPRFKIKIVDADWVLRNI